MNNAYVNEIIETIESYRPKLSTTKSLLVATDKRIFIHGAGNFGTATYNLLKDTGIPVEGFLDKDGGDGVMHLSKKVYYIGAPEFFPFTKEDIIIIAYICSEEALRSAKAAWFSKGYMNVFYFLDIYALLITNNLDFESSNAFSVTSSFHTAFNGIFERFLHVASMWADDESRDVFRSFMMSIMMGNPGLFSPMSNQPQYFVSDIPFKKGYARFIDCGAFDGDTASDLNRHKGAARIIACFEPDSQNFAMLCSNLRKQRTATEHILFPCGVWEKSEMLRFRAGEQSTSGISKTGDTHVQCVAIDDVIPDFNPTFIKMDVEGSEYEALLGAQNTITTSTPDLAISVYHRIDHMWEIPLLVESLAPDYAYYLRAHGDHGVETIMYAALK
ncbi:MAG TPA: FkbM family methyltransferase [Thermodesulfovibrionales bacterium]|nr:FkbM family methyltransferase [Thermodesulfovibrionales bacterium]